MSYADRVFKSMRPNINYSPEELSSINSVDIETVKYILRELVRGSVVSESPAGRYKRNKKYKTKQKSLF